MRIGRIVTGAVDMLVEFNRGLDNRAKTYSREKHTWKNFRSAVRRAFGKAMSYILWVFIGLIVMYLSGLTTYTEVVANGKYAFGQLIELIERGIIWFLSIVPEPVEYFQIGAVLFVIGIVFLTVEFIICFVIAAVLEFRDCRRQKRLQQAALMQQQPVWGIDAFGKEGWLRTIPRQRTDDKQ